MFAIYLNMVFNVGMKDKDLIISHGGPTKLARLLGLDTKRGGVQRVQNWMTRGIPASVKLEWPDLFLHFSDKRKAKTGSVRRT